MIIKCHTTNITGTFNVGVVTATRVTSILNLNRPSRGNQLTVMSTRCKEKMMKRVRLVIALWSNILYLQQWI